jgi:hypothetical protein
MAILSLKNGISSISGATVKGSFSYFSGGTRALGPSDVTGFYSGYDAPSNGYTVYQIYGASGFTSTVANNDTELNYILIRMGGTGTTVAQNITWATNTSSVFINPTPQVYSFLVTSCCTGGEFTLYSYSPSIIVGTYLYTNSQLTIPFYNLDYYLVEGSFDCNLQTYSGILTNPSGLVTSTTHSNYCGD